MDDNNKCYNFKQLLIINLNHASLDPFLNWNIIATMKAIFKKNNRITLQEKHIPDLIDGNDLLIKVTLAALCRTDLYVAQNKIPVKDGITIGHEFTGIVEKMGCNVDGIKPMQRVGVMPVFFNGDDFSMLGIEIDGAYADYIRVPASNVFPIPDELTIEEAAFLEPIAASLAVCNAAIYPADRGLIYGQNRTAELTRRILKLKGFNSIDVCMENQRPKQTNSYDFVIETSATTEAFEDIARLVKPKGMILLKSRPYSAIPMPISTIVRKEIQLKGVHYGGFKEGIALIASKQLDVSDLFGCTYSFEEAIPILLGEKILPEDKKIFFKP